MPRIGYQKRKFKQIEMLADGKLVWLTASAASKSLLEMRVAGDAYPRFKIRADGRLTWGGGAGALDIILERSAANTLKLLDIFWLANNYFYMSQALTTDPLLLSYAQGDSVNRFTVDASGKLEWGPGNAAIDCVIARRAANILNTPDRFEVGTLGVGNSASGDVSATSADYKVQVFDAAGNSLGYLQVYAG